MRAAGWRIVYADSGHVVHMVSPKREADRISHYGIRNQILFEALNAPLSQLPVRLARPFAGAISYRFSWLTTPAKLRAIGAGLVESVRRASDRRPVSQAVYRTYRALPHHGAEDWTGGLPPPCSDFRVCA
jgi:GT2 family glycosyltransferase